MQHTLYIDHPRHNNEYIIRCFQTCMIAGSISLADTARSARTARARVPPRAWAATAAAAAVSSWRWRRHEWPSQTVRSILIMQRKQPYNSQNMSKRIKKHTISSKEAISINAATVDSEAKVNKTPILVPITAT